MTEQGTLRAVRRGVAAAVAAGALVFSGSGAAAAVEEPDWWFTALQVGAAHDAGVTGAGVRIGVVDTGVNPDAPGLAGANVAVADNTRCDGASGASDEVEAAGHGTAVVGMLVGRGAVRGIAPDADVTVYAMGPEGLPCQAETVASPEADGVQSWTLATIKRAIDDGNDIVSVSMHSGSDFTEASFEMFASAIARGVIIVVSLPNNPADLAWSIAGNNGVVGVTGVDQNLDLSTYDGKPMVYADTSVVAPGDDVLVIGDPDAADPWASTRDASGNSYATPIVSGALALVMQKYPDATGNQVIQSLIHNTGPDDHPLQRDQSGGYGYGAISATHLLREDPAQYPDVNPLMDHALGFPTQEQVDAAAAALASTASPSSEPSDAVASDAPPASPDAAPPADADPGFLPWIPGGGVLALVLIIIVVVIFVARSRSAER